MAELNVQPKKKTSLLPWIILLLVIALLIWYFTRHKSPTNEQSSTTGPDSTTAVTTRSDAKYASVNWNDVDFNSPSVSYQEITDKNIGVRGNDKYSIYDLGENILFDENKATLRPDAEANLKQIAASVNTHYKDGVLRVYGYTDSKGDADANRKLAEQRANAVKSWLSGNGFNEACISVNAVGEARPVAPNSTDAGRQQNRRVEIVARAAAQQ